MRSQVPCTFLFSAALEVKTLVSFPKQVDVDVWLASLLLSGSGAFSTVSPSVPPIWNLHKNVSALSLVICNSIKVA